MDVLFKEMSGACEAKFNQLKKMWNPPVELLRQYDESACRWISEMLKKNGKQNFLQMGEELLKQNEAHLWVDVAHKGEYDLYLYLSLCYYHFVLFKHNENLLAEGCRHLQDALYYCGAWVGARERDEWDTHCHAVQLERAGRAKKAGQSRGEKFTQVKAEVVRLLKAKVPEGGWETKVEAIRAIEDELSDFIENGTDVAKGQRALMKSENLQRTISGWSTEDECIELAFEEVTMSKK